MIRQVFIRHAALAFITAIALHVLLLPAAAQEIRSLAVDSWEANIVAGYFLEKENKEYGDFVRRPLREDESGYREELYIQSEGYFYHPLLLDFDARLGIGLNQNRFITNTGQFDGNTDELLTHYKMTFHLLRRHRYATLITLSKSLSDLESNFFANRIYESTSQTVSWSNRSREFPSSITFKRSHRESRGNYQIDERRRDLQARNRINMDRFVNLGEYRFQTLQEQASRQDVQSHNLFFEQKFVSGELNPWMVTVGERFFRQSGTVYTRSASVAARTTSPKWHNTILSIDGGVHDYDASGQNSFSRSGQVSLSHELYQSVRSSIRGRLMDTRIGAGGTSTISGDAAVNYRKKIPVGVLSLGFQGGALETDDHVPGRLVNVIDEEHEAAIDGYIELDRLNADTSTIVLTSAPGAPLEIYEKGIDYFVFVRGERVEILTPFGGRIENGQNLLFKYSYHLDNFHFKAYRTGATGNLSLWRIWSFRASVRNTDEIAIQYPEDRLNDRREYILGGSMRLGPSSTSADYREYREKRTPLLTRRVTQAFSFNLPARSSFSIHGSLSQTTYLEREDTPRESKTWSAGAVLTSGSVLATRWSLRSSYLKFHDASLEFDEALGRRYLISFDGERALFSLETRTRIRSFEIHGRVDHFLNNTDNMNTLIAGNSNFDERDESTRFSVAISRGLK